MSFFLLIYLGNLGIIYIEDLGMKGGKDMSEKSFGGSLTMLVLALLEQGDKYGYQMIKELEMKSDGSFSMKEGTLYPILHGMENQGWVKSYSQTAENGRPRKYYRITRAGLRQLQQQKQEWEEYVAKVRKVMGGGLNAMG